MSRHVLGIGEVLWDLLPACAQLNVELDGRQHGVPDQRQHDAEREKFLRSHGSG